MSAAKDLQLTWNASIYDPRDTDLILIIDSSSFAVHKDVLQANSDYFQAMFSSQMMESAKDIITLKSILPEPFKLLLESFYTGHLQPTEKNVFPLCETGQMLQVTPQLLSQCTDYLVNLINCESVFDIMLRSNCTSLYLPDVYNAAKRFALGHFLDLIHYSTFQNLSVQNLCEYLSDEYLVVEDEMVVVQAIRSWLRHNNDIPIQTVEDIVSICIHMNKSLVPVQDVSKVVLNPGTEIGSHIQVKAILNERPKPVDIFLFWSMLDSTEAPGYVVQVSTSTWEAVQFDTMDAVEASPAFDMGSAVCTVGPIVYLSGGGNKFGAVNWIRDIWKFDFSCPVRRWTSVGKLTETRRHHAMVSVGGCLFTFGGFGKFRLKNVNLECFDLSTGNWESLPQMPEHEVSPAATTYGQDIYYLGRGQTIHGFSTTGRAWTSYEYKAPPLPGLSPVAMHVDPRKSNSFLGLFRGDGKICLLSLHLDSSAVHARDECGLDLDNNLTFAGSVTSGANMFIFLCSPKAAAAHFTGTSESLIVRSLCLRTGLLNDSKVVSGICSALSIVGLPHIPMNLSPTQCFSVGVEN